MTLQKDQRKQPSSRLQKIVWIVTLVIAGGCVIAAIVLAITHHINIF